MEEPTFSVIIPAYNEQDGIGAVLDALTAEPGLSEAEIIVVDDGSRDATAEQVSQHPAVRLVRHRINQGYGASIRSGVKAARGRYVIWFDADGQHRVEDLLRVARTLIEQDLDYCVGVRGEDSYQVRNRQLGKAVLRAAVRLAAGHRVNDFNSGLRGFRREVITRYLPLLPRGFGASTTTTLLMIKRGYYGQEVPIKVLPRVGKSTVRQVRDGVRTLKIVLRIFLLFTPMRFFGGIGTLLMLLGGVYGLVRALESRQGIPVLAALVILLGMQAFFFGIISDQISMSRLENLERD
jgi:glycosyltransferase involved in cell wall biosynthesis